jgi:hypothetical protein
MAERHPPSGTKMLPTTGMNHAGVSTASSARG